MGTMEDKSDSVRLIEGDPTKQATVYVVIPVYNRLQFTLACLRCLRTQTYQRLHLIVVDGGSTDGTVEVLKNEHSDVTLLQGKGELWWGGAMRVGVEYVLSHSRHDRDMVLMMNNDTEVEPSYVETLVRVCVRENAAVGSMVVDSQDPSRILDAGEFIDWGRYSFPVKTRVESGETFFDKVDVLPGRGTLVPLRMIRVAGNIEDRLFPHYIADYEFFQRLQQHGFRLGVSSEARIMAHIEETGLYAVDALIDIRQAWALVSSRKSMNNFRDHWRFIGRCAPPSYKLSARVRLLWRTAHLLILQTNLRYLVWPFVLPWRWLKFVIYDRYYVTAADCLRHELDANVLSEEQILFAWMRSDWYRFSRNRREWWRSRPELHGLYLCAWNPSTKLQRWVKARAHRAGRDRAA
jgi:GT2 family glycosyltransferase